MKINGYYQNVTALPTKQDTVSKAQTAPVKQISDENFKLASEAITSLGLASIAINKKNNPDKNPDYEECPEIVESMSRFTPKELEAYSKHENYKNIELLATLKYITPEGKEDYRYTPQEIFELADVKDFKNFFLLAQMECKHPQTNKYCSRYTNEELKIFIRNNINFELARKFGEILTHDSNNQLRFSIFPAICYRVRKYEKNLKEIEAGIKNIDDEKLRAIFEWQKEEIPSSPAEKRIEEQEFLIKKIDAYNNLTNKYLTLKQIDKKDDPLWQEFRKYCVSNDLRVKSDVYNDYRELQRVEAFIEARDKDDYYTSDPALNYIYENIYLNSLPESVGITPKDKEKLIKIKNEYGVRIIIPTSRFRSDKIEYIEKELEKWRRASSWGIGLRLPPTINLLKARRGYLDDTAAYGGSKASGYCHSRTSGKITLNGYENIEWALRHELMHCTDWKKLEKFPDSWYESDGKTVKSEIKNQLYNEFRKGKATISKKHFEYAFNNPMEFIAIASEGDMSKYSKQFITLLKTFGMPDWATNLTYNN